jgi:hypothetical protein
LSALADGIFWPSLWRRHPAGRYKGAVESNAGSSTAREGIMVQDRPGKHGKKSEDVAVAEKCGQSNGAEECVRLKKHQSGCMLYDCCMAHLLLIGLSLCKERIVKFVCSGWRRFARDVLREGRKPRDCSMHTLIPQQFCRLN